MLPRILFQLFKNIVNHCVTFSNVYQLQLLCGLLYGSWEFFWLYVMLTFLWVTNFLLFFICPLHSLLLCSFRFLCFSYSCLSYAGDPQNQRCFWSKARNGCLSGSKMLCGLASSGWIGDPASGYLYAVVALAKAVDVPPISPLPFSSPACQPTWTATPGPCAWGFSAATEHTWSGSGARNEHPSFLPGAALNQGLLGDCG